MDTNYTFILSSFVAIIAGSPVFSSEALTIDSSGNASFQENLTVSGTTTLAGDVTTDKTLTATGDINANANLTVADNAIVTGTLNASGATSLDNTLNVIGATTLQSTLSTGATTVSGDLTTTGTTTFNGDTTVASGAFTINGPQGDFSITPLTGTNGTAYPWQAKIDFGDGAGIIYTRTEETFFQGSEILTDILQLYGAGGTSDAYAMVAKVVSGTEISSPRPNSSLYLTSNGGPITISKSGQRLDQKSIHKKATLHIDGKIAHQGLLKLSDRKAKTQIQPIINSLEQISALEGVTYAWKEDQSEIEAGFIAQDVEAIFPELVSQDKSGTRYMNHDSLVPYLVEAIQEQQKIIEELQAENQHFRTTQQTEIERIKDSLASLMKE